MSLTLERRNFDRSWGNYHGEMGRTLKEVLLSEGALLVRDLVKLTPPRGPHPMDESYAQQRKRGLASVERDVKRVLRPLNTLEIVTNAKHSGLRDTLLRAAGLAAGKGGRKRLNFEETERLLRQIGVRNAITRTANPQVHRKARGSRGRVPKRSPFTVVVQGRTVKGYIKEAQKSVGRAKKGWMVGVNALGTKDIPQWVSGNPKSAPGFFRIEEQSPTSPALVVGNQVPYAGDFRSLSIVEFALGLRKRNMAIKAQRAVRALHAKRL